MEPNGESINRNVSGCQATPDLPEQYFEESSQLLFRMVITRLVFQVWYLARVLLIVDQMNSCSLAPRNI